LKNKSNLFTSQILNSNLKSDSLNKDLKINLIRDKERNLNFKEPNSKFVFQKNKENENTQKVCCNCKKSKCLKLYCDCFASGEYCKDCNCVDCNNKLDYEKEILTIKNKMIERNPDAFKPKIIYDVNKHFKGCNCKNSNCQKKYCECFQNGISCSDNCKCKDCKNIHLIDINYNDDINNQMSNHIQDYKNLN